MDESITELVARLQEEWRDKILHDEEATQVTQLKRKYKKLTRMLQVRRELAEQKEKVQHLKAELARAKSKVAEAVVEVRKAKMSEMEALGPGGA